MKTTWYLAISAVAAASVSGLVASASVTPETSTTATAVPSKPPLKKDCKKATKNDSHVKIHMDLAQNDATKEEKHNMATLAKGVFKGVASVHGQLTHTKSETTNCTQSVKKLSKSKTAKHVCSKVSTPKPGSSKGKGFDARKCLMCQLGKILKESAKPHNLRRPYRYFKASRTVAKSIRELKSKESQVLAKLASKDINGAEKHCLLSKLSQIRALQRSMHKNRFGPRAIGKKLRRWENGKRAGRVTKPKKNLKIKQSKPMTSPSDVPCKYPKRAKKSGKKTVVASSARQTGPTKNGSFVKNKPKSRRSKRAKKAAQKQSNPASGSTAMTKLRAPKTKAERATKLQRKLGGGSKSLSNSSNATPIAAQKAPKTPYQRAAKQQRKLGGRSKVQTRKSASSLPDSNPVAPSITQKAPKTLAQRAAKLQRKLGGESKIQTQANAASLPNSSPAAPRTTQKTPKTLAQRAAKLERKLGGRSKIQTRKNAAPSSNYSPAAPRTAVKAPKTLAQRAAKLQRKLNSGSQPSTQSNATLTPSTTQTSSNPSTATGAAPLDASNPQTGPMTADPTEVYTRSHVHQLYQASPPLRKLLERIAYTIFGWAMDTAKKQRTAALQ